MEPEQAVKPTLRYRFFRLLPWAMLAFGALLLLAGIAAAAAGSLGGSIELSPGAAVTIEHAGEYRIICEYSDGYAGARDVAFTFRDHDRREYRSVRVWGEPNTGSDTVGTVQVAVVELPADTLTVEATQTSGEWRFLLRRSAAAPLVFQILAITFGLLTMVFSLVAFVARPPRIPTAQELLARNRTRVIRKGTKKYRNRQIQKRRQNTRRK